MAGTPAWRTGVYQGEGNDDHNPASFGVLNNILVAVQKACRKELGKEFRFEFDERIFCHSGGQHPADKLADSLKPIVCCPDGFALVLLTQSYHG